MGCSKNYIIMYWGDAYIIAQLKKKVCTKIYCDEIMFYAFLHIEYSPPYEKQEPSGMRAEVYREEQGNIGSGKPGE